MSKEEAAQCGGRGVGGSQLLQKSPQGIQEEGTRAGAAGQTGRRGLSLTHPPPTAEELPAEVSFALRSWLSGPRAPGGTSGERAQGLTPTPRTARSRGPESGVCVYAELAAATEVLALCLCPPHTQREAERETPGCAVFTHTRARARRCTRTHAHGTAHVLAHTKTRTHTCGAGKTGPRLYSVVSLSVCPSGGSADTMAATHQRGRDPVAVGEPGHTYVLANAHVRFLSEEVTLWTEVAGREGSPGASSWLPPQDGCCGLPGALTAPAPGLAAPAPPPALGGLPHRHTPRSRTSVPTAEWQPWCPRPHQTDRRTETQRASLLPRAHVHTHSHMHPDTPAHMCTHARMQRHMSTQRRTRTLAHSHMHVHTHSHTGSHTCTHTHPRRDTLTHIHMCVHRCSFTHTFAHTCSHTHTCTPRPPWLHVL